MRKPKQDNLKTRTVCISLPPSFADNVSSILPDGLSASLQLAMASKVIGQPLEAFQEAYGDPEADCRFHRDSPAKELIRAARWILESKIVTVLVDSKFGYGPIPDPYTHANLPSELIVVVDWLIPGERVWCKLNLRNEGGYRRVLYDGIFSDAQIAIEIGGMRAWDKVDTNNLLSLFDLAAA